jgi:hypothetical protein
MTTSERRRAEQRPMAGGRRATDPIVDLESETRPFVTLTMLATYFMVERRFLIECVKAHLLKVYTLKGSEWRVKTVDARAFERSQLHPASHDTKPRQVAPVRAR